MTTAQTDRLAGLLVNSAIKNPCAVATTAAITLSGEQTIDGVTTSGSRVLVKNQASSIDNGIYVSDSGAWSRAADFNGPRDVVEGTLIKVNGGTTTVGYWYVSTTGSPVPGTDAINFGQSSTVLAVVTAWAQNILASASAAAAWVFIKVGAIADANTWAGVQTFATTIFNGPSSHTAAITMTGSSIIEAEGAAVTAASSTNIWATDGNTVHVTGNTGIADFATAPQAGAWMKVVFDGTPLLTQSANLNLNAGGSNIQIAAGDVAFVYADTTTQMDVIVIRKSGQANIQPSGSLVQVVNTQTGAVASGATAMPYDNSIPQSGEGVEFMTLSITPTNASNMLRIVVSGMFTCSTDNAIIGALFQDATAGALAAVSNDRVNSATPVQLLLTHYMPAGTTSATTFKFRVGTTSGGTVYFNGDSGGTRVYGGVASSSITIEEIKV